MTNVKIVELNINIVWAFLNTQTLKIIELIEQKCLCCHKNYQKQFDENLKKQFLIHTNFY